MLYFPSSCNMDMENKCSRSGDGSCNGTFCSESHDDLHRSNGQCFPILVRENPQVGRYLVAAKRLEPLDLILREETALPHGPLHCNGVLVCVGCCKPIQDGLDFKCERCGVLLCSQECQDQEIHKDYECPLLQEKSLNQALLKDPRFISVSSW